MFSKSGRKAIPEEDKCREMSEKADELADGGSGNSDREFVLHLQNGTDSDGDSLMDGDDEVLMSMMMITIIKVTCLNSTNL